MRVVVSGAGGMIGAALVPALEGAGHEVLKLVRRAPKARGEVSWDPERGTLDPALLAGVGGAVHLAGENIAGGRWTPRRRAAIRDSRVQGTGLLARTLASLSPRPSVLVSISASGWYGDRGDEALAEGAAPGTGFLAEVARAWEGAADPARSAGIRVVHPRLGIVLAREGGALEKLVPPARLGLGGPLGSGDQWWSWVTLDDVVSILSRLVVDDALSGPVNVTGRAVRQKDFAAALGRVLGRPAFVPAPAFALRAMLGAMADEMLLASQRMVAERLASRGLVPQHDEIEGALRAVLGRPS